jgi:hypothetical protein
MRAHSLVLAAVAASALAACSKSGSLVAVTVDSVTPLADVASLTVTTQAAGRSQVDHVPLGQRSIPPAHTFGIDVGADVRGSIQVQLDAIDSNGQTVATIAGGTTIVPGGRADLPLTFGAPTSGNDMAGGGGTTDMAGGGGVTDMAHPPLVWSAQDLTGGVGVNLAAVWGADASHVWISGHSSANTFFSTGNDAWTRYSTNPFYNVNGLWGIGAAAYMVDDTADVRILNSSGNAWGSGASLANAPSLTAVWGTSATNVWTVSNGYNSMTGGLVFHNTTGMNVATSWPQAHSDTFGYNAIHGAAADDFYIVGDGGSFLRCDGVQYVYHSFGTKPLRGVWAVDGSHVYAVGDGGTVGFSIGNGTFTQQTLPTGYTTYNYRAVWASAVDDVYVVGDNGAILHSTGNGTWTPVVSGLESKTPQHTLNAIWGTPDGRNVYAVSSQGWVTHGK